MYIIFVIDNKVNPIIFFNKIKLIKDIHVINTKSLLFYFGKPTSFVKNVYPFYLYKSAHSHINKE